MPWPLVAQLLLSSEGVTCECPNKSALSKEKHSSACLKQGGLEVETALQSLLSPFLSISDKSSAQEFLAKLEI